LISATFFGIAFMTDGVPQGDEATTTFITNVAAGHFFAIKTYLQEKTAETTEQNEERGENLSPRNRKACHSMSTAILQSVAEIGTQCVAVFIAPPCFNELNISSFADGG
jgi:hypothetical protein